MVRIISNYDTLDEAKRLDIFNKLCSFLQIDNVAFVDGDLLDVVSLPIMQRLCLVLGIRCGCNHKKPFFKMYCALVGEAIFRKLNIMAHVAPDTLRLCRYNGINFVDEVENILNNADLDEAMLDIFNFVDDRKEIIEKIYS